MPVNLEQINEIYVQYRSRLEAEIEEAELRLDILRGEYVDLYFQACVRYAPNKAYRNNEVKDALRAVQVQARHVYEMKLIAAKTQQLMQQANQDRKLMARIIEDISNAY